MMCLPNQTLGFSVDKPRDKWHTFWNAGETTCRILEIISPAGFDHYFDDAVERSSSDDELDARDGT